jgi:hypothetical protein
VNASEAKAVDGKLQLDVALTLPTGYKLNEMAPSQYWVEAEDATGLVDPVAFDRPTKVAPPSAEFRISLPLAETQGSETLKVCFIYYYCEAGDAGVCKVGSVVWIVPISLSDKSATDAIELKHRAN